MKLSYFDQSKLYKCKCKECKAAFETSAPSRILEPLCAACQLKENRKPGKTGLPPDFDKVQKELRKEFGVCPICKVGVLLPLNSFKQNDVWVCGNCAGR